MLVLLASLGAAQAGLVVEFTKAFAPSTIGPGSVSTLTFTITNPDPTNPLDMLAFTDTLPAGVTIASPSQARSFCGGTLSAPNGGTTITFSDGMLGASQSCTIRVDVTSATVGTHMNLSGALTSDAGTHGTASADLDVALDRPGFTKSFAPSSVALGGRSNLTFTIDNTANASDVTFASFTDTLPAGMVIANPANATTDCVSSTAPNTTLTANPGSTVITLTASGLASPPSPAGSEVVNAGASCTVSVDVSGGAVGMLGNTSGDLDTTVSGTSRSAGKAAAVLTVTGGAVEPILLLKEFTNDPVPPGGNVTLVFTLTNTDRDFTATGINFDDDVDIGGATITYTGLEFNSCNVTPTGIGTGLISFSGGSLAPEASCSFGVTLAVPAGVAPGTYTNTTTPVMADVNGTGVTGSAASDLLFVEAFPLFTKEFIDDPAGAGGSVTLRFTFTNTTTLDFGDLEFTDDLNGAILGLAANGLVAAGGLDPAPQADLCGMGSELTIPDFNDLFPPPPNIPPDPTMLIFTGGSLAAAGMSGDSCFFDVILDIPTGIPAGIYVNTTSAPTATSGGIGNKGLPIITGQPAAGDLVIVGAPRLTKEFTDDPTAPGGMVTLEFTLEHDVAAPADATGIAFSDDLDAALTGLVASGTPPTTDCAGATVDISTPTLIDFSGGTLTPGETCTASVELTVPGGAMPGSFPNTTSDVTATVGGAPTTGNPGSDSLRVAGLMLTKEFTNDPAIPGDTVNLRFTLDNTSGVGDATAILFTDNLGAVLTGLMAVAPPPTPCGGTLSGTSTLLFSGGSVPAGMSCFFDVDVLVPAMAANGSYANVTSTLSATIGGVTGFVLDPAFDVLVVDDELLAISKSFTDDPATPGGTVILELILDNLDLTRAASAIAFSDDLGAALPGLTIGSVLMDDCGGTLTGVGTDMLGYSGGSLAAAGSCTVRLSLDVPAGPLAGDTFTNTTSNVTGTINGFGVFGAAASDDLRVVSLLLEKSFGGVGFPGQTVDLTFTITNLDSSAGASNLSFSDSLPGGLSAVAPLPPAPCGAGSTISGTTFLTVSNASLGPGGMCSFPVTVQVPGAASPGMVVNTTGDLFSAGISVSGPGTDTLTIEPPPAFAKAFAPASRGVGQISTLSFSIDNSASTVAATGLAFTDNLPAGVDVAATPAISNACGGTVTAPAGTASISFSGGSVGAGMSCVIGVNVAGTAAGALLNTTGDLTSSSGNSGPASDTLTVNPQPAFAKAFAPNPIAAGAVSTLTFTIGNTGSTVDATSLDFTDPLPAAIVIATPSNVATTCTGGTLTAADGSGLISYTGGTALAGASCTVSTEVTSATPGSHVNTSGDLTSSLGNSGTAGDTLTVTATPPVFAKSFAPNPIVAGGVSTLTFSIDNTGSLAAADNLDFSDSLPPGVVIATPSGAGTTCTGGTLTAPDGGGAVSYTGGTASAGTSCTVSTDVTSATPGSHVNTSGDLTSSLGNSGPAGDTLIVNAGPVPAFVKSFAPDAIGLGGTSTLTFTIDNSGSLVNADNLDFTDNLPAGVVIATPSGVATTCTGGTLTAPDGGGTVGYTGGTVAGGASCNVTVDVTGTAAGMHVNTSGDLTSTLGNSGPASAMLDVAGNDLSLAKAFVSDPILPGGTVAVEFTVTNSSTIFGAGAIAFTDDLNGAIPGMTALGLPISACGGTLTGANGDTELTFSGGSLGANASCVIAASLRVPASAAPGSYTNTTGNISGDMGGAPAKGATIPVSGPPASATFNVAFLSFSKAFAGDVPVGGIATLGFTISNPDPANGATAIGFMDDLNAFIPGAVATGLPQTNVCGAGSTLSGTSVVSLSGGSLGPGASCTFQFGIQIPDSIAGGGYTNTTGSLQATVGGAPVTGAGAVVATAILGVGAIMPVPALNTWGLLAIMGLLLLVGAGRLRRTR